MENLERKKHWENVYQTKQLSEVSWYQPNPATSLQFIQDARLDRNSRIIDIGGGDSFLVDYLLDQAYKNLTVLDVSEKAIERAKKRLGEKAGLVTWIVSDVTEFSPTQKYDLWHDRAAFHFLTESRDISKYISTLNEGINPGGMAIIGTFSERGPKKCSGLDVCQYSEKELEDRFNLSFNKVKCVTVDHSTPFDTLQNFTFCSFRRKSLI